jgi:nucleoside-diphosphate-sugar epimerase
MKIVVTGATGMIGEALVESFLSRGDDVVALSRGLHGIPAGRRDRLHYEVTDYSDTHLQVVLRGAQAVVHLAAMRPSPEAEGRGFDSYYEANVKLTEGLLIAAGEAGVESFCQASTIAVYSLHNRVPFREADAPHPLSFYGASKLACEQLGELHGRKLGMRVVSLRLAQILGRDSSRREGMFMRFMHLARNGETLQLWGEGRGARDAVYLKDVVGAFECALAEGAPAGSYNIGGGRAYSNLEVAEAVNDVFGNRDNLAFDLSRQEDRSEYHMDCSSAEAELGWRRKWSFVEGLEELRFEFEHESGSIHSVCVGNRGSST